MLRVPITKAKPGMVLALPIHHPKQPSRTLLRAGATLQGHGIERLVENGVRLVYVRYPGLELLDEFINPALIEARTGLTRAIAGGFDEVARSAQAPRDFESYRRAVGSMLDRIAKNRKAALFVDEMHDEDDALLDHSSSVCFLSLLLGVQLETYLVRERPRLPAPQAADPTPIGMAGLLHDVGMLRLDREVRKRWDRTWDEHDARWREHTRLGYELVRGGVDPAVAAAVLNHHQHFDGSGFPTGLTYTGHPKPIEGRQIHIFARIVCAADLFDRLRRPLETAAASSEEITGARAPVVRALSMMLKPPYRRWVDPIVLKGLLAVAPPYPPGSLITLTDGMKAVVTDWSPKDPCRPTIQPLRMVDGYFEIEGLPVVDLQRDLSRSVAEIDGYNVARDNFSPSSADEFDLNAAVGRLVNRAEALEIEMREKRRGA